MQRILAYSLIALAVLAAGATVFVYSGVYDVAATKPHLPPVYYLVSQTMRHSIKRHAAGIASPEVFDAARVERGRPLYREHCLQCHGEPGVAPDDIGFGLYPPPPNLVEVVRTWPAGEIFWAIKHGIKMTGMPAWQRRLGDDQIWDIVAFMHKMQEYSPQQYAELAQKPAPPSAAVTRAVAARAPDAHAGRRAIDKYLCTTCHVIPDVPGATNSVGPSLRGVALRNYIAGTLPNTPDNMTAWLEHPQRIRPGSAMPELGVSADDARDIAAYLYTLNQRAD